MDISLLRTFLEVAVTRHFGKAAEHLFVTQSAVSARIKLLEDALGVALFSRKRNDIQLTPAGNRFKKHADTIVKSWARAKQDLALQPGLAKSLAVGSVYDLWGIFVRDWALRIREEHPEVALEMDAQPAGRLVQRLVTGELDLAFLFEPPQMPNLLLRQVGEIKLVMVAHRPDLTADEALRQGYLFVDWGTSFQVRHAELFPDLDTPAARLGLGSMALDLLLAQGGSAYLAESMVADALADQQLHRVEGAPEIQRYTYVVFRPEAEDRDLVKTALELARQTI